MFNIFFKKVHTFKMNYLKFEKKLLDFDKIELEKLLKIYNNNEYLKDLNKKELQIYWEIKPILYSLNNIELVDKFSNSITDKLIFKKKYSNLVKMMLKLIDDIIILNDLKLNNFLVFKDFISTIIISSLNDKLLINMKENNYLYSIKHDLINDISNKVKNFIIFFDKNSNYKFNVNDNLDELIDFVDSMLMYFVYKKLILKKIKKNKNKKIEKVNNIDRIKTTDIEQQNEYFEKSCDYFALNQQRTNFRAYSINLKIFFYSLETLNYNNKTYFKAFHYLSISEVYRENKASKKPFILNDDTNILKNLSNMQYNIDYEMYLTIFNKIKNKYNLNDYNDELLENYIFEKYLNTLKRMPFSEKDQIENSDLYHSLIFIYLKKYDLIYKESFYMSYYFDFRGRLYSDSIISPVGFKWFRYLYNYGVYSEFELENIKHYDDENYEFYYNYILENISFKDVIETKKKIKYNYYITSVCFFEIGKIFKSKYLEKNKNEFSYLDFIKIGIDEYNDYWESLKKNNLKIDFKREIEIIYILNILSNWKNNNYIKSIIWKDATASAIQIQTVLYGSTNNENYFYTNLLSDGFWRDTYYYILLLFKSEIKKKTLIQEIILKKGYKTKFEDLNFEEKYFNRDSLKKVIMTYNYSATIGRCYYNFLDIHGIVYKFNSDYLKDEFSIFYYFLKHLFNNNQFFNEEEQIIHNELLVNMFINNNYYLNTPDNSKVPYEYFVFNSRRNFHKYGTFRGSTQFRTLSNKINKSKMRSAYKPNYIHSLDATIVRLILNLCPKPIITIHDSFGVDILNTGFLIKAANIAINKINKKKSVINFYSKFILL